MNKTRLDPVSEQAIDWMVRLRAGKPDAALQARFNAWLAMDPAHAQAWEKLQERLGGSFNTVLALDQRVPGQRQDFDLSDGSRLSLNADSAVDLQFDEQQRLVILRHGALVIQVEADPRRPLRVRTAQGEIRALGTRFLVAQEQDASRVVVLQHSVQARLFGGATRDLQEGQAALLSARQISVADGDQRHRADWLSGRLNVLDEPLEQVVETLRPYSRGFVRVAPEVRSLRVQGVFPLDDPDRTYAALAETVPIRVDRYSRWLTLIRAK